MGFSGIDRANPFVLVYYNAQGSGFPLFIFPAGFGFWGFGISGILDIFDRVAGIGDVGRGRRERDVQFGRLSIRKIINNYDPVHMIGHDNKFAQSGKWKMIGDFHPKFLGDIPGFG